MFTSILLLSDLSYALGIIGLAELQEREEIAYWLSNDGANKSDPRGESHREASDQESIPDDEVFVPMRQDHSANSDELDSNEGGEPDFIHFLALGCWYFTIGDRDCIPSVPHGHENAKTQKWPKLNPYTGRVFTGVHIEDPSRRLNRTEMRALWRNADFVDHCRKQVGWYSSTFASYKFSSARRGILAFPRW